MAKVAVPDRLKLRRLRNSLAVERAHNTHLQATMRELLTCYWGRGDGEPPPAFISDAIKISDYRVDPPHSTCYPRCERCKKFFLRQTRMEAPTWNASTGAPDPNRGKTNATPKKNGPSTFTFTKSPKNGDTVTIGAQVYTLVKNGKTNATRKKRVSKMSKANQRDILRQITQ
jgi:hypothetical protein